MEEISKHYNPLETEKKWLDFWNQKGIFRHDPKKSGVFYSIDTPPPTVSGRMHIGHAYSYTHEDFIARYRRMKGENVFFPFGTDDNGLPTERLVEKLKNVRANKMKRMDFIKLCNETLREITPDFIEDWKKVGMSCDFSKTYSTIDDSSRRTSQKLFVDLYEKKKVFRREAPVVWCPHCQTAIAQAELEDQEQKSYFNDLIFEVKDGGKLVIATTRPELLSSCVAIFVHPKDKRYGKLVGKKAKVPIFNQWVEIMTDSKVEKEKGSGAVMCCTFGDKADVEWYKKYHLPLAVSIDKDGRMTEKAKKFKSLTVKEARAKILEDLRKKKLLVGQKEITHAVNIHERCKTEIEIINSVQWYVSILKERKIFLELGKKIKWYPEFMRTRFDNWVKGLSWDWAISRQRFFGVPFPVWYCESCGEVRLANVSDLPVDPLSDKPTGKCQKCGASKFIPERDVMDTWATSSISPQLALQLFYNEEESAKRIPMNLRPQAHDIISTWLFYTVVRSHYHSNSVPWRDVMISGHVLDKNGRKMSKSIGNVVAPQEILDKYGADALRFWSAGRSLGQNINYSEEEIQAGKKFLTKLWNVTRFVMMNVDAPASSGIKLEKKSLFAADRWILAELQELILATDKGFKKYDFASAKLAIEKFFWIKLADNYIEIVKNRLYNEDPKNEKAKKSAQVTLHSVLFSLIKMLAPFVPFAAEEIYQTFFKETEGEKSVHLCAWPEADEKLRDKSRIEFGKTLLAAVGQIRKYKAEKGLSMKAELEQVEIACNEKSKKMFQEVMPDLVAVGSIKKVTLKKGAKLNLKIS